MDATTFIAELSWKSSSENLTASEYFKTSPGRTMLNFIGLKVHLIDATTFALTSNNIAVINSQPLYRGRDFVTDMESLGFSYEISSTVKTKDTFETYTFKVTKV